MFPSVNGEFYPHIEITDELWPEQTVFKAMMKFAAGTNGTKLVRGRLNEQASKRHRADGQAPWTKNQIDTECDFSKRLTVNSHCNEATGKVEFDDLGKQVTPSKYIDLAGHPEVKDRRNWRIVSLRIDPCAAQNGGDCEVEFRLIAQPVDANGQAMDYAAHLLYHLVT